MPAARPAIEAERAYWVRQPRLRNDRPDLDGVKSNAHQYATRFIKRDIEAIAAFTRQLRRLSRNRASKRLLELTFGSCRCQRAMSCATARLARPLFISA